MADLHQIPKLHFLLSRTRQTAAVTQLCCYNLFPPALFTICQGWTSTRKLSSYVWHYMLSCLLYCAQVLWENWCLYNKCCFYGNQDECVFLWRTYMFVWFRCGCTQLPAELPRTISFYKRGERQISAVFFVIWWQTDEVHSQTPFGL